MNERIRELAWQAKIGLPSDETYTRSFMVHSDDIEKFAELIVRECIKIGQDTSKEIFKMSKKEGDVFEYKSHGAEEVADNIKEHFGVEE